jgi:hypothetical protein
VRILEIIVFEFLLGYILQAFSIVLGLYAFNKQKIDLKKYIITSLVMSVVFYVTRLLPVAFGVHTILDNVVMLLCGIIYLRLPDINTIKSILFIDLIIFTLETLSILLFIRLLGEGKFTELISREPERSFLGLSSSILFAVIMISLYWVAVTRKVSKPSII